MDNDAIHIMNLMHCVGSKPKLAYSRTFSQLICVIYKQHFTLKYFMKSDLSKVAFRQF